MYRYANINPIKIKKMKKRLLFCFVALSAMLFTACGEKEEPVNETPIADNTIVYDGKTYEMIPFLEIYNSNLTMLNAFSKDTSVDGMPKMTLDHFHIRENEEYSMWNTTTDLLNPNPEMDFYEIAFSGEDLTMMAYGSSTSAGGEIDGVSYENESVFKSGTMKITGVNDGSGKVLVEFDFVLKNNKSLKMRIRTDHVGLGE